ncbi:MAG: transcription elongation factor GreA [bacterium]
MVGVKELYVSKEGLAKLREELDELKAQRVEITQKIKEAREFGDLSENAEYQEARTKQSFTEGRIEEIETTLKMARVIDDSSSRGDGEVTVGSTVVVEGNGRQLTYYLTGSNEASPEEGKISNESPLGQALLGRRTGELVTLKTPDGDREYKVVQVG